MCPHGRVAAAHVSRVRQPRAAQSLVLHRVSITAARDPTQRLSQADPRPDPDSCRLAPLHVHSHGNYNSWSELNAVSAEYPRWLDRMEAGGRKVVAHGPHRCATTKLYVTTYSCMVPRGAPSRLHDRCSTLLTVAACAWLCVGRQVVVVECGAGLVIPSARCEAEDVAERFGTTLVRINPTDYMAPKAEPVGIGLPLGSADALCRIWERVEHLRGQQQKSKPGSTKPKK